MAVDGVQERLKVLAKRVKKLDERIERQKIGPEVDASKIKLSTL